jgi:hypothetical protein
MLHIDRSLVLNASTLKSLQAILETAKGELARQRRDAERSPTRRDRKE